MSKRLPISLASVCLPFVVTLNAQDEDLKLLTFNVGGGLSVPLNPTGTYFGVSGNAGTGVGANFNDRNSVEGDFLWTGLLPSLPLVHPVNNPTGNINLYTVTGNYRFHVDSLAKSPFGFYVIGGGGWYYRHTSINKKYVVPLLTVCQPIYNWWGFACDSAGYVETTNVVGHGSSAGGLDAGVGFTVKIGDMGWKFFAESRYNYAWSKFIPTVFAPVSFGFRFN